jgi:hypothetical protein
MQSHITYFARSFALDRLLPPIVTFSTYIGGLFAYLIQAPQQNVLALEPYLGLLVQIPVVFIFVWFALSIIKIFIDFTVKRDESWQAFIASERTNTNESIKNMAERFAGRIGAMEAQVSELKGKIH